MTGGTERLSTALEGRYRVLRRLGEGGMALVYLAEDLKHHRQVALKILRPELAAALGAERFLREIEIAARLTHPNILPLLDSGDADGTLFYVMPFVEGESLRQRLVREGQLPVEEAVKIGQRVAGALAHAHSLGIVHRDIKPENILLSGGEPVVADFGIAKAVSEAGQTTLTESGFAVGTAPYMSPEQAGGERQLDGRSDLYSLGCVLYEMLAGAPPFTGPTLHAITARKLTEPVPPLRNVRETVPAGLEQVVLKALARLPADRYATGAQLAEALEAARTSATTPSAPVPAYSGVRGTWRHLVPWAVAAGFALVAGVLAWRGMGAASDLHLSVTTPRGTEVYGYSTPLVLSPDGRTLVFAAGRNDSVRLYLRRLDSFETHALPGTDGGDSPFFSPDGRWVGFFARKERQLRKVALAGGAPVAVALELGSDPQYGVWGRNDTIYFANWPDLQISEVAASGGPVGAVTHGNPPNGWFRLPLSLAPDGRHLLVVVNGGGSARNSHLDLVSLATGEHRLLLEGATEGRLVAGRYLLYVPWDHNEIRVVAFDPQQQRITGDPVTVLDSVGVYPDRAFYLAVAPNGTLAYAPLVHQLAPDVWADLVLVGRDGRAEPERLPQGAGPRFSPGGWCTRERDGTTRTSCSTTSRAAPSDTSPSTARRCGPSFRRMAGVWFSTGLPASEPVALCCWPRRPPMARAGRRGFPPILSTTSSPSPGRRAAGNCSTPRVRGLAATSDRYFGFSSEGPEKECRRIQAALARHGPIDVCVLGLGINGHIGFNEPGPALLPHCHVARLSEESRRHAMVQSIEAPRFGLTLGMQEILAARRIVLLVAGEGKAEALAGLLSREVTTTVPASFLWLHQNVDCLIDRRTAHHA